MSRCHAPGSILLGVLIRDVLPGRRGQSKRLRREFGTRHPVSFPLRGITYSSHTAWIHGCGFLRRCSGAAMDLKGGTGSHRWTRPHVIIILDEGGLDSLGGGFNHLSSPPGCRQSGRKPHKLQKLFEMVDAWNGIHHRQAQAQARGQAQEHTLMFALGFSFDVGHYLAVATSSISSDTPNS